MNTIKRLNSVVTREAGLRPLWEIEDFPVFFGAVDTPKEADLRAPMKWAVDPISGVVQLTELIPLDVLYSEQHVDGVGPTWEAYYKAFADYVVNSNAKAVLEIGGGAGKLAYAAIEGEKELSWTIIEPNPVGIQHPRIAVIPGFFDRSFSGTVKYDTVVFSQVLEHAYDPRAFLDDISSYLEEGGRLVFAYPNLALWLKRKYTNALNFEHTMLLTDEHLDVMLPEHGFRVLDKVAYRDHSFFYVAEKIGKKTPSRADAYTDLCERNSKLLLDFVEHHKATVLEMNRKISEFNGAVYLFGAHIFSTYLFAFGLDPQRLAGLLDNSSIKRGRRFYGTNFKVESPEVLRGQGQVAVLLRAGIYTEEIKTQILESINPDVVFI